MRISLYTFVKDGLRLDYHVVAMLKHHARLFDELVVVEGLSTDGTYEAICNLASNIRVIRRDLGPKLDNSWMANAKDQARRACTGDWCVLLDCDEFLPEWEFERLRPVLSATDDNLLPVRPLHFYGSYRVHQLPQYAVFGYRIHRNQNDIEVWGDGMNVRQRDVPLGEFQAEKAFEIHHFGEVRYPARLREKWRAQGRMWRSIRRRDWMPSFLFDVFPHRWCDPEILPRLRTYDGPYVGAVNEDPDEFVRDRFQVHHWLQKSARQGSLSDSSPVGNSTCSKA